MGSRLFGAAWRSAYILLTFTALFWAGNAIVGRAARDVVPPVALSFWRWSLAFLILLPFAWRHLKRDGPILRRHWRWVAVLGTLGIGAFNTLLYTGLTSTTALNALLIQAAQPGLILLAAALLMHDKVTRRQVAGVALAAVGVVTIVARGDFGALAALQLNRGDAIVALAVLLWSLYSVLLRHKPQVHPLSFLAATMGVGVAAILPFYLAELASGARIVAGPDSLLAIGYVSVFPSLIAYMFFNRGVELIGAASTGQYLNVMPIFGAALAVLLLGEALRGYHVAGIVLVGAGILLAGRGARPPPPAAPSKA